MEKELELITQNITQEHLDALWCVATELANSSKAMNTRHGCVLDELHEILLNLVDDEVEEWRNLTPSTRRA